MSNLEVRNEFFFNENNTLFLREDILKNKLGNLDTVANNNCTKNKNKIKNVCRKT